MYTFIIQYIDLLSQGTIGLFFIFFVLSWLSHIFKNIVATRYNPKLEDYTDSVSVVIPVIDEPIEVWTKVLNSVKEAVKGLDNELIVVGNGSNSFLERKVANELGFMTLHTPTAGKREALYLATKYIKNNITIILDSDTIVNPDSIKILIRAFSYKNVGGATPNHQIFNRDGNFFRKISDWMEDIRFNEVLPGQSINGGVSCLPGRMLAIRTNLLKESVTGLLNQTFMGNKCISGDDRYLTSWLLKNGHKCVYVPESKVFTNSPDTLLTFVKQRLRWSRTSLRETILSLGWILKYPYTAFTVLSTVFFRWMFFIVVINGILSWSGIINTFHTIQFDTYHTILFTVIGFFVSGFIRHLRHLFNYPKDLFILPWFLIVTTFILTPVEWFGNITLKESGWMTRKVE